MATELAALAEPRLEVGLTADGDRDAGPFIVILKQYLPGDELPGSVTLFSGRRLTRDAATQAILQIYAALGERFRYGELEFTNSAQ